MRFASTRWIRRSSPPLWSPRKWGCRAEQVFKTLLCVTSDKQHVFAVVPGDAELDFKKLAAAAGARKAEMVSLKDVQPLTGYVRGGVTVFGAKKEFSRIRGRDAGSVRCDFGLGWDARGAGAAEPGGLSASVKGDGGGPDQSPAGGSPFGCPRGGRVKVLRTADASASAGRGSA